MGAYGKIWRHMVLADACRFMLLCTGFIWKDKACIWIHKDADSKGSRGRLRRARGRSQRARGAGPVDFTGHGGGGRKSREDKAPTH